MKELEKNKLLAEIIAFGILINQHTDYCVFVRYSGHVDSINVELCESKRKFNTKIFEDEISTAFSKYYQKDKEDVLNIIKTYRDVMKQILEDGEIPYDNVVEHVEQVTTYSF